MNRNNIEINVLIKGRRATEFLSPQDFQTYLEGREGSNFEIEVVNNNHTDVEAIISVDGLAVTDGKPAGEASSGYIVNARSRILIPGWTLDKSQVAKFFFAGQKGGSYVEQSEAGDERNKGVIGAKVFARKVTYTPPVFNGMMRGVVSKGVPPSFGGGYVYASNAADSGMWSNAPTGAVGATATLNSMSCSASAASAPMLFTADSFVAQPEAAVEIEQTLGTGFGEAQDFATSQVSFERGDMIALVELFYDDANGLKRRGIDVRRAAAPRPSAFPADEAKGCTPPAGWNR